MSKGLNRVTLLGNVGADPELRYTGSGTAVLNFRIATTDEWLKDGEKQERTDWHRITVWGARGEGLAKIITKGQRLYVEGQLRTSDNGKEGDEKRYYTEVHATEVLFADGKPAQTGGQKPSGQRAQGGGARKPAAKQATGYDDDDGGYVTWD